MDQQVPSTTSGLKVSIIIPVYNGGPSFRLCLKSLEQSTRKPDEIIVVADGDTDGSSEFARSFGATVFRYPSAGGPARARNRGATLATGDVLFFVDADVTVHPDTVAQVEEVFQSDLELAALIGSYDDDPGASNFLSQYKNLFHHYTHQISSSTASTFWGACGAIRRHVFFDVGGFDEGYRKPCVEDIELGYRLKQSGYSIRLCKRIQVKHLKCWRPLSLLKAEVFYRALPWSELLLGDRQFNADLNLSHSNRISVVCAFLLVVTSVTGFFVPPFLGLSIILAIILLITNWSVYQFFLDRKGLFFTLRVIPWHWLYFLYGGGAFAYGVARYFLSRLQLPKLPMPHGIQKSGRFL
ncbi:glycosyltransferase [Oscillatoria sp. CS-180]|uniref:glycosyltransferase family 2 protein n=1 Tax=Oscillatoria sp. CS-180 TaxID=3021720 RepID=UPI00232F09E3|nr:glycosyltransferase [Oscillatoria sp. CS-180]MDB9527125.1 glycosyltransferase [Oscillatoria sp. CS-180]